MNEIIITINHITLKGFLEIPDQAKGLVIFVHGSGSSRHSSRNQFVANELKKKNLGFLLFDLLTKEEEEVDVITTEYRFDIPFLTKRLLSVTEWMVKSISFCKI